MPQISPMNWILISIMTLFTLMMIYSTLWNQTKHPTIKMNKHKMNQQHWKW